MLRLVAYAPNGAIKFPLGSGRLLLGSSPECDLVLDHPDVEELHAVLRRQGRTLEVESSGSSPLAINGRRTSSGRLELLDELEVGGVSLVLEDSSEREALAAEAGGEPGEGPVPSPVELTVSVARQRLLDHLSALSSWVLSDAASSRSLESALSRLLEDFGGGAVFLFEGLPDTDPAVKLLVTADKVWLERGDSVLDLCRRHARLGPGRTLGHFHADFGGEEILICFRSASALNRNYFTAILLPKLPFDGWSPELGFATVADLAVLGLVHHVGRYEPILPGRGEQRELTLAPGMVVGPSPRMSRLMDTLQALVDSPSNVLLLGESGTGRELIARSLHASGPRRRGPFVAVDCEGVDERQLTADLFGAEVSGRGGPVRREGRLELAADGTLFLRNVELLPMTLQRRLIHVLRSGGVQDREGGALRRLDFGIVSATNDAFYDRLSSESFRIDLAGRIAQVVVRVPPLRDRLEDLPLLLQTMVNRFSHETGRRIRGITTRTLETLGSYHFPGNLTELENTVRQMIYVAPEDAPLDLDLLPPQIRSSRLGRGRGSGSTKLADLVSRVERDAIAEALEKTGGNKSQTARMLGLSRNGLAQKMRRYRL